MEEGRGSSNTVDLECKDFCASLWNAQYDLHGPARLSESPARLLPTLEVKRETPRLFLCMPAFGFGGAGRAKGFSQGLQSVAEEHEATEQKQEGFWLEAC